MNTKQIEQLHAISRKRDDHANNFGVKIKKYFLKFDCL